MQYTGNVEAFLTIAIVHLLAVMSPGPDFILVTKHALTSSKRTGLWTALGIALGILVHVAYSLLGIGFLIAKSIVLFNAIKYLGAAYLIYIGWKALTHRSSGSVLDASTHHSSESISAMRALRMGFVCNVLNPKATLFFLALFTQVVSPATPLSVQIGYGLYMCAQTFVWFAFVSEFLSLSIIKRRFEKIQDFFSRIMGGLLIALGLRIALSSRH